MAKVTTAHRWVREARRRGHLPPGWQANGMSGRRRGNGEGSIYRRADGLWAGAVSYADAATGKRERHTVYGRTRTEVRGKLREARSRLDAGGPVRDARETVGAFAQRWIDTTLAASGRKASTKENYAIIARTHLVPAPFGALPFSRVQLSDVEALILAKHAEGKSASTVRLIYTVARGAP